MWQQLFSFFSKESSDTQLDFESIKKGSMPQHIAIIMDGNGRWAKKRGMPRALGHRAGADTLRDLVREVSNWGVKVLTVYGFSTENWKRPVEEVGLLMSLIQEYLQNNAEDMHRNQVRIRFIGNVNELPLPLQETVAWAENLTRKNNGLILNMAVNYGSRAELKQAIVGICQKVQEGTIQPEEITDEMISQGLYTAGLPDPDLLIRPSGDYRISNFLLWQLAYTEFWFSDLNWPDFTPEVLLEAINAFQKRERRFGGLKK